MTAVVSAAQNGRLDPQRRAALLLELERAGSTEQIAATAVPDVVGAPAGDPGAWQVDVAMLELRYLEPGAGEWYAGIAQPQGLLVVSICRDLTHHAREIRARLREFHRLRCAAAGVPLARLREVDAALRADPPEVVNDWGIDIARNTVVVTTDADVDSLAARLTARFGDAVTVEYGEPASAF